MRLNSFGVIARARLAVVVSCLGLLAAPLALGQSQAVEPSEDNESQRHAFGSLQKSLLIPGWGQLAEKRYLEAGVFFGAEVFCWVKVFSYNHKANEYYDRYKAAGNMEDAVQARKLTERNDARRNQFMLAALGIWVANLADTYVIVKGKQGQRNSLRFWLDYGQEPKIGLVLSYRF